MSIFALKMRQLVYILLVFSFLNSGQVYSQSTAENGNAPTTEKSSFELVEEYMKGYYSQVFGVSESSILNFDLYQSVESWLGTPYRYAGKSDKGIDCSTFVNKIYDQVYCFLLNGNSAEMASKVSKVPRNDLKEGDLVFFKINRRSISHVGVYLGNDKFAHASRSKGVIVSDLNHPYYRKYFVKGGRVSFPVN